MTFMHAHPIWFATLTGLSVAAGVDLHAFLTWRKDTDWQGFAWRTAVIRWAAGAILGFLTGLGIGGGAA